MTQWPITDHDTIIQRIRAYNHLSLAPENRGKMEKFYTILVEHVRGICKIERQHIENGTSTGTIQPVLQQFNVVLKHLYDLSEQLTGIAGKTFRSLIINMVKDTNNKMDTLGEDESDDETISSTVWPDVGDLMLLKLISHIFPTSDYRHNVVTPTMLMMCEWLVRLPVRNERDIYIGLYVVSMLLHYIEKSQRYIPEIISYLYSLLIAGFGLQGSESKVGLSESFTKTFLKGTELWKNVKKQKKDSAVDKPSLYLFFQPLSDNDSFTTSSFRSSLFLLTLNLIKQTAQMYIELPSFIEIVEPFVQLFKHIKSQKIIDNFPSNVQQTFSSTFDYLESESIKQTRTRRPLQAEFKPSVIKQHTPVFVEAYQPGHDYDPIKERAETKKLQKKLNREKRGAMKELRKDTAFIAGEKRKIEAAYEAERKAGFKQAWTDLQNQARDSNILHAQSKKKQKK